MNTHKIQLNSYYAICPGGPIHLGTAGSHGNEQLKVIRGNGWENLVIQVLFHPCGVAVQLPADGIVDVPWEATHVPLSALEGRIVFQGFEQNRLINSTDLHYIVSEHSITVGRDEQPYTPSIIESVLNQMTTDKSDILLAAESANLAKEEAATSAAAAQTNATQAASWATAALQNASDAQVAKTQASTSAANAASHATVAGEILSKIEVVAQQALHQMEDNGIASLNQIQVTAHQAMQQLEDTKTDVIENIAAVAPILPTASSATSWQSITVKSDGSGYDLTSMAPHSAAICPTVTGNPIVCHHSASWRLQALRIYGKSTQDGTPCPESPVPIINAGERESIEIQITGANLIDTRTGVVENKSGCKLTFDGTGKIVINGTSTGENDIYFAGSWASSQPLFKGFVTFKCYGLSSTEHISLANGTQVTEASGSEVVVGKNVTAIYISLCPGKQYQNITIMPMVNWGKSIFPFEPFIGLSQFLTISAPDNLPGIPVNIVGNYTDASGQQWICNIKDYSSGKYLQRAYKIVLDQNSNIFTAQSGDFTTFSIKLPYMAQKDENFSQNTGGIKIPALSDYYEFITSGLVGSELDAKFGIYNYRESNVSQLFINDRRFSTIEEYKAWLANNPVTFIYAIEAPIQSDIPPEELAAYHALTTYDGTTVINTPENVAGLEVRYTANGTNYLKSITDRIAALEAIQNGL